MKQHLALLATVLLAAGCAQFTTSGDERSGLAAGAKAAGDAYIGCLSSEAGRYAGTTGDVAAVTTLARGNCATARDAAARAQTALQESQYILADPQVEAALKDLDARGQAAVAKVVLDAPTPTTMPAVAPLAAAVATPVAAGAPAPYLDCMREQASRWADVAEPATVIADAAHGRCAARLAGVAGADALEREGRAIVTGIVLDRKAGR